MMYRSARALPIRRGRRCVPPAPGMIPSADSVCPMRDRPSSTMIRKSQQSVISLPPPRACPLMAAITGLGQRSIAEKCAFMRFMNPATWPAASGALRSMLASEVRSAPTLKYFSYSDASTIARTEGSPPSSLNAAASSPIKSSAIELLPLRCMTTRATAPSRVTSKHSPISGSLSEGEEGDAARHPESQPRDVARFVRAEEGDRMRDVRGLAGPLEDRALDDPLVHLRVAHVESLGADHAGHDGIGRDVVAPSLERSSPGERDGGHLRRRGAGLAAPAHGAGDRGHVDDPSPFLFDHVRPNLLGAVEGAGEVDVDVAIPQLVAHVLDLADVVEGGSIIDQDVDAAELVLDLLEDFANLIAIRDVHLD